jgi:hypothetical protein
MRGLKELVLKRCGLRQARLDLLGPLQTLQIDQCDIVDIGFVSRLSATLRDLSLVRCKRLKDVSPIASVLPTLVKLAIIECKATPESLTAAFTPGSQTLRVLNLTGSKVDDQHISLFNQRLLGLQVLDVGNSAVRTPVLAVPMMQELSLEGCDISRPGLAALCQSAPVLTRLVLKECHALLDDACALFATLPQLVQLDLSKCLKLEHPKIQSSSLKTMCVRCFLPFSFLLSSFCLFVCVVWFLAEISQQSLLRESNPTKRSAGLPKP